MYFPRFMADFERFQTVLTISAITKIDLILSVTYLSLQQNREKS